MNRRISIALALLLTLVFVQPGVSAKETTIEDDIRELIELSGTGDMGKQMSGYMSSNLKGLLGRDLTAQQQKIYDEMLDDLQNELGKADLYEVVGPVYERHFTHEEIKGLIKFYKTPLGSKVTRVLPQVITETIEAGQQWSRELSMSILQKHMDKMHEED